MKNRKSVLLITPGDPAGIGPEITWKAIRSEKYERQGITLLCVGARKPFEKLKAPIVELAEVSKVQSQEELWEQIQKKKKKSPAVFLIPTPIQTPDPHHLLEGYQSGWSIQNAVQLIQSGFASALITGPISKDRLQKGGYPYPGHTEFLADLCRVPQVTMMLANSQLRVSLVTTHLGLKDVSSALTRDQLRRAIHQTVQGLHSFWGVRHPRIAIAALNPHAGESGRFGREEIEIIEPELNELRKTTPARFELIGPLPADTLFAKHILTPKKERWDAVVALYHDQGLIPVKLLDFHRTVNITLGLPIIRTSVDHGVGFDIAGKGLADASSLKAAIELAAQLVQKKFLKKGKVSK